MKTCNKLRKYVRKNKIKNNEVVNKSINYHQHLPSLSKACLSPFDVTKRGSVPNNICTPAISRELQDESYKNDDLVLYAPIQSTRAKKSTRYDFEHKSSSRRHEHLRNISGDQNVKNIHQSYLSTSRNIIADILQECSELHDSLEQEAHSAFERIKKFKSSIRK